MGQDCWIIYRIQGSIPMVLRVHNLQLHSRWGTTHLQIQCYHRRAKSCINRGRLTFGHGRSLQTQFCLLLTYIYIYVHKHLNSNAHGHLMLDSVIVYICLPCLPKISCQGLCLQESQCPISVQVFICSKGRVDAKSRHSHHDWFDEHGYGSCETPIVVI